MNEKVGRLTGKKTQAGRDVYETPEGEMVSEKSTTFMYKGKKYTTALKSESKKFPGGYKDIIKQHKTSKKKRNTGGMNPDAKSSRYRYGI